MSTKVLQQKKWQSHFSVTSIQSLFHSIITFKQDMIESLDNLKLFILECELLPKILELKMSMNSEVFFSYTSFEMTKASRKRRSQRLQVSKMVIPVDNVGSNCSASRKFTLECFSPSEAQC